MKKRIALLTGLTLVGCQTAPLSSVTSPQESLHSNPATESATTKPQSQKLAKILPQTHTYIRSQDFQTQYKNGITQFSSLAQGHFSIASTGGSGGTRPSVPTHLFNDNFASFQAMGGHFANLAGESNPDNTTGWQQWNTDYFAHADGVSAWNPIGTPYDTNRNNPGEYASDGAFHNPNDLRPNLLETAISKTLPLSYIQGDKLIAKARVSPNFTDDTSDVTLVLYFNDPARTVAISNTIRGKDATGGELFINTDIPSCATEATVVILTYLGENESGSATIYESSLEFIPQNYYQTTRLLDENFNQSGTHPQFGPNFPLGFEEQFGPYNIFTEADPSSSGGLLGTVENPAGQIPITHGGLVKTVILPPYQATDLLSANLYVSSTFSSPESEVMLHLEFFDNSDTKLGQTQSSKVTDSQFRWTNIDRASIPVGTTYVKLVPTFKLATDEQSSFVMDSLSLDLVSQGSGDITGTNPAQCNHPTVNLTGPATETTVLPNTTAVQLTGTASHVPEQHVVQFVIKASGTDNIVDGPLTATDSGGGTYTGVWNTTGETPDQDYDVEIRIVPIANPNAGDSDIARDTHDIALMKPSNTVTKAKITNTGIGPAAAAKLTSPALTPEQDSQGDLVFFEIRDNANTLLNTVPGTKQGDGTWTANWTSPTTINSGDLTFSSTPLLRKSDGSTLEVTGDPQNFIVNRCAIDPEVTLLGNHSFEIFNPADTVQQGNWGRYLNPFPCWNVTSSTPSNVIEVNTHPGAPDGNFSTDANADNESHFYQDVPTVPGKSYRLSLYKDANGSGTKQTEVIWNNQIITVLSYNQSTDAPWTPQVIQLPTVSGNSSRLEFRSLVGGSGGMLLDDMRLTEN